MPTKNKGRKVQNWWKIDQKSQKNTKILKPRFWITFFIFLAQFGRPKSIQNHPKSFDFSVQNFEAKKCKIGDATIIIGVSNSTSFCSLGGRGETNKTYSHRTVADYLTTPMGQRPGEFFLLYFYSQLGCLPHVLPGQHLAMSIYLSKLWLLNTAFVCIIVKFWRVQRYQFF